MSNHTGVSLHGQLVLLLLLSIQLLNSLKMAYHKKIRVVVM